MTLGERLLGMYGIEYRQHQYCDNCAGDLPPAYCEGIVRGTPVAVCSGRCLARLMEVWAPARKRYPIVPVLVGLLFLALVGWR